jgi:hypothetical protein
MQKFFSLLSWRLFTSQHVSGVFPPIIISSMTAVAVSGFTFVSWWARFLKVKMKFQIHLWGRTDHQSHERAGPICGKINWRHRNCCNLHIQRYNSDDNVHYVQFILPHIWSTHKHKSFVPAEVTWVVQRFWRALYVGSELSTVVCAAMGNCLLACDLPAPMSACVCDLVT